MRENAHLIAVAVLAPILLVANLLGATASESPYNLTVSLTVPGTQNTVYVPGEGSLSPKTLTTTNPPRYYLSSHLEGVLYALVFHSTNPGSLSMSRTQDNHTLRLTLSARNPKVFLVFSKGDYRNIQVRMPLIESFTFLSEITPAFSYGLGYDYPIRLLIENPFLSVPQDQLSQAPTTITLEYNKTLQKVTCC